MARGHIKSRASFRSEVWTEKRESARLTEMRASWLRPFEVDLKSSDLESEGESRTLAKRGARFGFGFADDAVPSRSPIASSIIARSPAGSKLPSSDLVVCSGSKARAAVGAANPSKIKSPRISRHNLGSRN